MIAFFYGRQVTTVDRKYFKLKIFCAQKFVAFNFCGWNQQRKLNTDHTLYATAHKYCSTMDMHRTLEKERRDKLILLKTVLQSHSLNQLSNVDQTLDRIMTEGCGQIGTTIN